MPTEDIIEYDLDLLDEMIEPQLLIQLIARSDLKRPKREAQLQATAIADSIIEKTEEFIVGVAELGVPILTAGLTDKLEEYKTQLEQL